MRPKRRRIETLTAEQRRELLGVSLAGLRAAYPVRGDDPYPSHWGTFASEEQRREAWARHRGELLPEWNRRHPDRPHYLEERVR